MAQDRKDLLCTAAEMGAISSVLAGIAGFDPNVVPWKQLGDSFFFVPEAIAGSGGNPDAVLAFAKYVLSHP